MKRLFESLSVLVLIFVGFCFLQTTTKAIPDFYAGKGVVCIIEDKEIRFGFFEDSRSIYDFSETSKPAYADVKNLFKTVKFVLYSNCFFWDSYYN